MIIIDKDSKNRKICIVLQPNRSIAWPLLLKFYLFTCCVSFTVAILFSVLGYWMVLPFSGLEMLLLGAALYYTNRCSFRQEIIRIDDSQVLVEKGCTSLDERYEFDRYWVRLDQQKETGWRKNISLSLGSHGQYIELGSFLTVHEKESLAFELNQSILSNGFFGANTEKIC